MNEKVDWYFDNAKKWQAEIKLLRTIILNCQLTEALKWGVPTYTYNHNNIVLIHTFKNYCAILFPKGVLLQDTIGGLIQQTENVQSARQIRFRSVAEIVTLKAVIKAYTFEACKLEDLGLKVALKKTTDYNIPEELQIKLDENPALTTAFNALTQGRQRAYIFYFTQPKQSKTRSGRVEKYTEQILLGKGLDD
jgi:uncharacterized protein YdeI (YjbR/CyaY-like superfamily)